MQSHLQLREAGIRPVNPIPTFNPGSKEPMNYMDLWGEMKRSKHPALCRRFAEKHHTSEAEASRLFEETKRFLFLAIISGEECSPSAVVDEMWHEFITYTVSYRKFCERFNGAYIDHTPSDEPELEGFIRTKKLATEIFGELPASYWPDPSRAAIAGKCSCSNKGCSCNCKSNIKKDESFMASA